jgi:hypothetical protein
MMELILNILGYTFIAIVLAGVVYTCYKILHTEIKDNSENDD